MSGTEDQKLFELVKKDHLPSFEKIFRAYYEMLTNYALGMVRDRTIAEEITQELFMYVWEKRSKIQISSSLKAYLFSSVRNKSINYLKNELPRLQSTEDISSLSDQFSSEMTTDDSERLKWKIQLAIDDLPRKCRDIFTLSRYGGLTYAEIADELSISVKTVENQMGIALKKLKESLKDELDQYRMK